jgi:hypothetical protein
MSPVLLEAGSARVQLDRWSRSYPTDAETRQEACYHKHGNVDRSALKRSTYHTQARTVEKGFLATKMISQEPNTERSDQPARLVQTIDSPNQLGRIAGGVQAKVRQETGLTQRGAYDTRRVAICQATECREENDLEER